MNDTQFLSELKRRLISKNVDADSADKYAEQFKRYFDNLSEDEIEEQVLSLGNMDSIVDNLVSLINAKKARSAQGGQRDKTDAERKNSDEDKADVSGAEHVGGAESKAGNGDGAVRNGEFGAEVKSEGEPKSGTADCREPEAEVGTEFKAETETEAVTESKSETETKAETESKPESKQKPEFQTGSEEKFPTIAKTENQTEVNPKLITETAAGDGTNYKSEAESKCEFKAELKGQTKSEPNVESEAEVSFVTDTVRSKYGASSESDSEPRDLRAEAEAIWAEARGSEARGSEAKGSEAAGPEAASKSESSVGGASAKNSAGGSHGADGTAKADMPPELPDESDIFCGTANDNERDGNRCDPERELTMLQGGASVRKNAADGGNAVIRENGAACENSPVRRSAPVRRRGQRRSYGYYDSEGFSREAYNAAYMDSNSEAEFVISSEAPTAEASMYMRRERVPVPRHEYYDYGYEPEERASGIRRYIYPQTRREWLPLTSEAGKSRFRKIGICSLPLVLIAAVVGTALFAAVFAVLAAAIAAMLALLIAVTVVGTAYSLISIIYGITQLFSVAPIGLYEIGIGIASVGLTMIAGIAVYNAAVRYMPYSIKYLLLFFTYVIDRAKGIVYNFREECANLK